MKLSIPFVTVLFAFGGLVCGLQQEAQRGDNSGLSPSYEIASAPGSESAASNNVVANTGDYTHDVASSIIPDVSTDGCLSLWHNPSANTEIANNEVDPTGDGQIGNFNDQYVDTAFSGSFRTRSLNDESSDIAFSGTNSMTNPDADLEIVRNAYEQVKGGRLAWQFFRRYRRVNRRQIQLLENQRLGSNPNPEPKEFIVALKRIDFGYALYHGPDEVVPVLFALGQKETNNCKLQAMRDIFAHVNQGIFGNLNWQQIYNDDGIKDFMKRIKVEQ